MNAVCNGYMSFLAREHWERLEGLYAWNYSNPNQHRRTGEEGIRDMIDKLLWNNLNCNWVLCYDNSFLDQMSKDC